MSYQVLDQSDFDDFDTAICNHGPQPEDFELTETITGLEKGVATVRSKKSGVERSYPIGNGTIFPGDFALELGRGVFIYKSVPLRRPAFDRRQHTSSSN